MRKVKEVVIEAEGRDKGKKFVLREGDVFTAEWWFIRALRIAERAGVDVPGGIMSGASGVAAIGIMTVLSSASDPEELRPLLSEMLADVKIITDQKTQHTRALVTDGTNDDIEEISTLLTLRQEWLTMHLNFSVADAVSKLIPTKAPAPNSRNTKTSHHPSAR
jgi:hypothetical protein